MYVVWKHQLYSNRLIIGKHKEFSDALKEAIDHLKPDMWHLTYRNLNSRLSYLDSQNGPFSKIYIEDDEK